MKTPLKAGNKFRVRKIGTSENPVAPSEEWEDMVMKRQLREAAEGDQLYSYHLVAGSDMSVPVEYEVVVTLERDIEEGQNFQGIRTERNGVEAFGYFVTSPIQKINPESQTFETLNSIYNWTVEESE